MVEIEDAYVGMRVMACVEHPDHNERISIGLTGTVCRISHAAKILGVRWDQDVNGHTCRDTCEDGYGWNVGQKEVDPLYEDLPDFDVNGVHAGILLA